MSSIVLIICFGRAAIRNVLISDGYRLVCCISLRSVSFLAGTGFLHVKETDVQRVSDLNLGTLCRRKVPERIIEPACPPVVWCLCRSFPQADEEFLRLAFEVPPHLMLEFVFEHNALFSTKIVKTPCISRQVVA